VGPETTLTRGVTRQNFDYTELDSHFNGIIMF
jgi:hypothetical protein